TEKLLLKRKAGKSLKTERVPRSSMLERLQNFLPQMAEANMKLTQQMEKAPPGHFDIENVDKAEKVIEMNYVYFLVPGVKGWSRNNVPQDTNSSQLKCFFHKYHQLPHQQDTVGEVAQLYI
uniref:NOP protein chaperone 1 n=1 Tax=Nothobranchius furzeri TaxID=105023 RepID=A0A8C6P2Q6_NOTFU